MTTEVGAKKTKGGLTQPGISHLGVKGYKSLYDIQTIEVRPLTILAGANSSGKTSMVQPLLLLKQTLEASYDPGALLLSGPNVRFTSAEQLLSRTNKDVVVDGFSVIIASTSLGRLGIGFKQHPKHGFDIEGMGFDRGDQFIKINERQSEEEIRELINEYNPAFLQQMFKFIEKEGRLHWRVVRDRCLLEIRLEGDRRAGDEPFVTFAGVDPGTRFRQLIQQVIHLPGHRGNPTRAYPVTSVGSSFPGTFENYTASVIVQWQDKADSRLEQLGDDLRLLGLTWKVSAKTLDQTQVEIQVGRLPRPPGKGRRADLVNVADVGFGVSQTLPVLVALRVARPGQLVYIEQPEIHLHPRAQTAMAEVVAEAARRGVRVVAETHSSLFLLGIQTLVAEGKLSPDLVKLHWFRRQPDGSTEISSADLDETGRFGDWPEDFAEISLEAESRYLDAAESKRR